jgi:deoxyribodipyrimidine photo-lyase
LSRRSERGRGCSQQLAAEAAVVVTDDSPAFFLPRLVAAAARDLPVRLEAIDGNGLLPLRAAGQAWTTASQFRRFLQKTLPAHLSAVPAVDPLAAPLPVRLRELPPLKTACSRAVWRRIPACE